MGERIIKSAERVKNHGEVFTPREIVDLMLDQPEITTKVNDLHATFLEPAAGEGAFLTELLIRKMDVVLKRSDDAASFGTNCLIGLSTLYGIEILEDNVEALVMNMNDTFRDYYHEIMKDKFDEQPSSKVLKSAKIIIKANMAQGDTLKRITSDGSPIIFSEWTPVTGKKDCVQRTKHTFDEIVEEADDSHSRTKSEQLDLFDMGDVSHETNMPQYAPCKWEDIYKEQLVSD